MKFLKFVTTMLCCGALSLMAVSCDKDDKPSLKFSPDKTTVAVGATATVTVSGGAEAYTVTSGDMKTATVTVNKNVITVTGVKAGKTTVQVVDKNKMSGQFTVTVTEKATALSFDKTAVSVGVGKEDVVTVKSGTAPYTATVKEAGIATATVADGKITVKGVKVGSTTITVTDKDKLSGTITVTVK